VNIAGDDVRKLRLKTPINAAARKNDSIRTARAGRRRRNESWRNIKPESALVGRKNGTGNLFGGDAFYLLNFRALLGLGCTFTTNLCKCKYISNVLNL